MLLNDFKIGQTHTTPSVKIEKKDVIEFAKKYDPLYFHIDEKKAKESTHGNLIASGIHLLAIVNGEWLRMNVLGDDVIAGVGVDNLRWRRPVFINDEVYGEFTVSETVTRKNRDNGYLILNVKIKNQFKKTVATCEVTMLIKCK